MPKKFILVVTVSMLGVLPGAVLAKSGCSQMDAQISCPTGQAWDHDARSCQPVVNS